MIRLMTKTLGTDIPANDHISLCASGITVLIKGRESPNSELNSTPQTTAKNPPMANTADSRFMPLSRPRFLYQISPPPSIIKIP